MTTLVLVLVLGFLLGVIVGLALDDVVDLWRSSRKGSPNV